MQSNWLQLTKQLVKRILLLVKDEIINRYKIEHIPDWYISPNIGLYSIK